STHQRPLSTPPRPPLSTLFPYTTLFRSAIALLKFCTERHIIEPACHQARNALPPSAGARAGIAAAAGPCRYSGCMDLVRAGPARSEEHTSELQSRENLVCRLLLEKKKDT